MHTCDEKISTFAMSDTKKRKTEASEDDLHAIFNVILGRVIPDSEWKVTMREASDEAHSEALTLIRYWMVSFTKQSHVDRVYQMSPTNGVVERCLTEAIQLFVVDTMWTGARISDKNMKELLGLCEGLVDGDKQMTHPQTLGLLLKHRRIPLGSVTQSKLAIGACLWLDAKEQANVPGQGESKAEIGPVLVVKTQAPRHKPDEELKNMRTTRDRLLALFPRLGGVKSDENDTHSSTGSLSDIVVPLASMNAGSSNSSSSTISNTQATWTHVTKKPKKASKTSDKKSSSRKEKKDKEKKKKKKKKHASSSTTTQSSSDVSSSEESDAPPPERTPKSTQRKKRTAVEVEQSPVLAKPVEFVSIIDKISNLKVTICDTPLAATATTATPVAMTIKPASLGTSSDLLENIARYKEQLNWYKQTFVNRVY
jgi:hypothetical protein